MGRESPEFPLMSENLQRRLRPAAGFPSSEIGLFLAQLDDQSRRLLEDLNGITPDELRWQIRPALEEGTHVIAAPYLETVIGFGRAAGLSQGWLRRVLAFAPPADICYRVPESTIHMNNRGMPSNSFLEFCFAHLRNGPGFWDTGEIRRGFLAHLDRLEAGGKCSLVTSHTPEAVLSIR